MYRFIEIGKDRQGADGDVRALFSTCGLHSPLHSYVQVDVVRISVAAVCIARMDERCIASIGDVEQISMTTGTYLVLLR